MSNRIEIATMAGPKKVNAFGDTSAALVVTESAETLTITHRRSGCCVGYCFDDLDTATKCCAELLGLGDWDQPSNGFAASVLAMQASRVLQHYGRKTSFHRYDKSGALDTPPAPSAGQQEGT